MRLALFDLDHTLIPFDSGMALMRFLADAGALPADAADAYLAQARLYVAGAIGIHAMHRASVLPLAQIAPPALATWLDKFETAMRPKLPIAMRELAASHQRAGDRCAIVTATSRIIAAPFARLFGVDDLVATESQMQSSAAGPVPTGEIDGVPCHREHKLTRVSEWLRSVDLDFDGFEHRCFYSDSASDLPLLTAVDEPVAVAPDAVLRAHALKHGWRVIER